MWVKLFWLLFSVATFAQTPSAWRAHTSAKFFSDEDAVAPGEKVYLGFHITLEKNWHTYWLNPGDSGAPIKLRLWSESDSKPMELVTGPLLFPIPKRIESGPLTSFVYDDEVLIMAEALLPDSLKIGNVLKLRLEAEWLVCADICIPATDQFELALPIKQKSEINPSAQSELFEIWRNKVPHMIYSPVKERREMGVANLEFVKPAEFANYSFVDFFPFRGSFLSNNRPTLKEATNQKMNLTIDEKIVGERRADLIGLLVLKGQKGLVALQWGDPSYGFLAPSATPVNAQAKADSPVIIVMLLFAFLGGLILNLMPCVFPILSMKLLSLIKQTAHDEGTVRFHNWAYVVGVVASFLFIGGVIGIARQAGASVGWGFQLQSPIFVVLLAWLFFVLSVQMLGYFEFEWLNPNWGSGLLKHQGATSAFFTGVLAVVVASPCTAPFMGAAIGVALSQSLGILLLIFFCLGLGMSFPYLMFAIYPSWIQWMPRPGQWMQTIKEFLAFPMLLTSVWLVWLLAQLKGSLSVGLVLTGMVGLFFGLWVSTKHRNVGRIIFLLVIVLGLFVLDRIPDFRSTTTSQVNGLEWNSFSEAALIRKKNETLFVDFTADWCLTCKLNEHLVFENQEVREFLKSKQIRLVRGDWTNRDDSISRFLTNYQRAGVPFYIAFGPGAPEGRIFPEVLTPDLFLSNMKQVLGDAK